MDMIIFSIENTNKKEKCKKYFLYENQSLIGGIYKK